MSDLNIMVSHAHRFCISVSRKCGSSTVAALMGDIHGLKLDRVVDAGEERKFFCKSKSYNTFELLTLPELLKFQKSPPFYKHFAITRNPYERLQSAYFDKLNRMAKNYYYGTYIGAQWFEFSGFIRGVSNNKNKQRFLRSQISIPEFVSVLEREGLNWDPHFCLQSDQLKWKHAEYDAVIDLVEMETELVDQLMKLGVDRSKLARLDRGERNNFSSRSIEKASDQWDMVKSKVRRLYAPDFEAFGYEL